MAPPLKHSVAAVVRDDAGAFLAVKRPDDPNDPLAGAWGLPAITLRSGESEADAVRRVGREKLGVELAVGEKIGTKTADRGAYVLTLTDYAAAVVSGTVTVPQRDTSMTQYASAAFVTDPGILADAAANGSLCAQIYLESA